MALVGVGAYPHDVDLHIFAKLALQPFTHHVFAADVSRIGIGFHLVVNAPHIVGHQVLPHCAVFVEGRFNPGVAFCGWASVKFDIGNAPTVIAFFAFHADACPSMEGRVRARCVDHMIGLNVVGIFWGFNTERCKIFVLFESLHTRLPAQINMPQFLNSLHQKALNVELLNIDEGGLC